MLYPFYTKPATTSTTFSKLITTTEIQGPFDADGHRLRDICIEVL